MIQDGLNLFRVIPQQAEVTPAPILESSAVTDVIESLPFVSLMRVFLHLYGWWCIWRTQGAEGGVRDSVRISGIYSKDFLHLILWDGNNTLLELDTDVLSCFEWNTGNSSSETTQQCLWCCIVCIRMSACYLCLCSETSEKEASAEIIFYN